MTVTEDVAELIRKEPTITAAEVAKRLALSEKTLRAGLRADGTHYDELRESVRSQDAKARLLRGEPCKAVAKALGFMTIRGFLVMFKRWTGMAPSEWREVNKEAAE